MEYEHRDFKNMIFRYLSDPLDEGEREAFERHIPSCPDCARELEEAREMNRMLDSMSEEPPAELAASVMARIKADNRRKRLVRITRIALPAAMIAVIIAAAVTFPLPNSLNKTDGEGGNGTFFDTDNKFGTLPSDAFDSAYEDQRLSETYPDIFFFFSSEGYLQGSEESIGNSGPDTKDDSGLLTDSSPLEPDSDDVISGITLPDGINSNIVDEFRMQIKLVRSYIMLKSLPDGVGEPVLIYGYRGYSVYIYEAGDSTLPSGMTDMYPDGEFSLIIIG